MEEHYRAAPGVRYIHIAKDALTASQQHIGITSHSAYYRMCAILPHCLSRLGAAAPTVSLVIIGARNEAQLRENLSAVRWMLEPEQIARLDAANGVMPAYPCYPYRT